MTKQDKFNKQMESYKEGIVEDLKSGRNISAIIQGYGFIYQDEFNQALQWCKEKEESKEK